MKIIQLKTKLSRMPIIAIFFAVVMFVASCTTDDDTATDDSSGTTEFGFANCPADILMQVQADAGSFPSAVSISWTDPTVVNSPNSASDTMTGPTVMNVINPVAPTETAFTNGSEFPIVGMGESGAVTEGDVGFYTVTYTVSSLDAAGETVPGVDCVFQVRLLAGTDTTAPTFTAGACPDGMFNSNAFSAFTTFMTDGPDDSEVLFSELMVTLPAPPGATVPLLTALAGNIMDNFDSAVPPSAITVGVSNADTADMSVNVMPTTVDTFDTSLELPVGDYTVTINAVDTAGNNTATDVSGGNSAILCTLTVMIQQGPELEQ